MKRWFVKLVLSYLWWLDEETCEIYGTQKALEFFQTADPGDVLDVET